MKITSAVGTVVVTVLGLGALSQIGRSQNLLTNGDFEQPVLADGGNTFFTSPAVFPGFTVTSGSVDINRGIFPAFSGSQSLDLVGNDLGTIQQTFNTTIGQNYVLTFEFGNNPFDSFNSTSPALATVTLLNVATTLASLTVSHFDSTTSNMDYQLATLPFVATGTQTTLQFQALTQGSTPMVNGGVVIDAVSVVPEPTSLTLAGISGITTMLVLKRRRRLVA